MNMKFEIIENEGLELIGIVKKIEMKKGGRGMSCLLERVQ